MTLTPRIKFRLVVGACLLSSFGGFIVCVIANDARDAGLGGDLAVALALFTLFINADFLEALKGPRANIEEGLRELGVKPIDGESLQAAVERLRSGVEKLFRTLVETSDDKHRENSALAWTTAIGVVVGAVGERAAEWLLKLFGHA
jgi:hypothetical protein